MLVVVDKGTGNLAGANVRLSKFWFGIVKHQTNGKNHKNVQCHVGTEACIWPQKGFK